MNAQLNPDIIRRAVILKKIAEPNVVFEPLIPVHGYTCDNAWLKSDAISHEIDDRGEHLVLWIKNQRITVHKDDAIFPIGPLGFTVVSSEIISYLRPALYRMLDAEGYEPAWVTQADGIAVVVSRTETDFSDISASTEAST